MLIGNINDFTSNDFKSPYVKEALDYIHSHDLLALPVGKYEIDGTNVYLNRQSYLGKAPENVKIEGHDHYLDLQLVLKGKEGFGYVHKNRRGVAVSVPYDPLKDKTNYSGPLDGVITLQDGDFALVYPNDLHAPCLKIDEKTIEKAVFKIKID
jgi:biofilm protein TabA